MRQIQVSVVNPPEERFRRRSFIVFAFLVAALVIGLLETTGVSGRFSQEDIDAAKQAAEEEAARQAIQSVGWTVVCDDRNSTEIQSARLSSFNAKGNYWPRAEEAIVDGCHWANFRVHLPLLDTDLPPMSNTGGPYLEVRWYRGDITFLSGPRDGEALSGAFILLSSNITPLMNAYAHDRNANE